MARRLTALLAVGLAAAVGGLFGPTVHAGATAGPAIVNGVQMTAFEARLVSRINEARQANGRSNLTVEPGIVDVARAWAAHQTGANTISHNPNLVSDLSSHGSSQWTYVAENVGNVLTQSTTSSESAADTLFAAYWHSPTHKDNLLDARARVLGLGVVGRPGSDGSVTYFNTMDFTDSYASSYGPTREPAYGLRAEERSVGSGRYEFATFANGVEPRVLTGRTGTGMWVDAPRVNRPGSADHAVKWDVRASSPSANGAALLCLRDSLDLGATPNVVIRLAQANPTNRPLRVDIVFGEYWGAPSSVVLGHLTVYPGNGTTFRLALPAGAREFRNVVTVQVTSASLAALSPSLSNRRATLALYSVVFNG